MPVDANQVDGILLALAEQHKGGVPEVISRSPLYFHKYNISLILLNDFV